MSTLNCQIPQSVMNVLEAESKKSGESISSLVTGALSRCFGVALHTLFQISTTGALVEGLYEKAVSSKVLLKYGDFGLGTFENLDGEMVILDGAIYQVRSNGTVTKVPDEVGTPFAVVVPGCPNPTVLHGVRAARARSRPSGTVVSSLPDRR